MGLDTHISSASCSKDFVTMTLTMMMLSGNRFVLVTFLLVAFIGPWSVCGAEESIRGGGGIGKEEGRNLFYRHSSDRGGGDAGSGSGGGSGGSGGSQGECRQPPEGTNCIYVYAPVVCGEERCEYPNLCVSTAALYNPLECVATGSTCPLPDPDSICITLYAPVWCEGACVYDNRCIAENAGFTDPETCTEL